MSTRAERVERAARNLIVRAEASTRFDELEEETSELRAALAEEAPKVEAGVEKWPTYNHVYTLAEDGKDERFVVVGGRVCLSREDYEIARRAVNRSAAVDEVIAAARRVVAHWQIVAAPVDAFGVDTMGKLTGELDAALAKVKGE